MKEFILDVNVETDASKANCPNYLFEDLRAPNKVRLVIGGSKLNDEVRKNRRILSDVSAYGSK